MYFVSFKICGQDVHFSQFMETKSVVNPALIGFQDEDYQAHFQRRSQWSSVTVPFNTFSISLNAKNVYQNLSVGATFLNDVAGDSHFSTDGLSFSIINSFDSKNNLFSLALLSGFYQRSVNFSNLIFLEHENINNTNFIFFDIGIGTSNFRKIDKNSAFLVGASAFHLNRPNQSLIGSDEIYLQPKYVVHATYFNELTNKIIITPTFYFSSQLSDKEMIVGTGFSYKVRKELNLNLGSYSRLHDALIVSFGLQKENLEVNISYDINTSTLANASNNIGGFEFSVSYGWSIMKEKKEFEQKFCPKYL